jgi:hypothetical protein
MGTKGITLHFRLKALEDMHTTFSFLTDILSDGELGESARMIPDFDEKVIFLELRDQMEENQVVKRLVREFKSKEIGEVDVRPLILPQRTATDFEVIQEHALKEMSDFKGSPQEFSQRLTEISEPKHWVVEQIKRLQYKLDTLGSEITALKVKQEDVVKADQRRFVERTKPEQFYKRLEFWFSISSLIIAGISIYFALKVSGLIP